MPQYIYPIYSINCKSDNTNTNRNNKRGIRSKSSRILPSNPIKKLIPKTEISINITKE